MSTTTTKQRIAYSPPTLTRLSAEATASLLGGMGRGGSSLPRRSDRKSTSQLHRRKGRVVECPVCGERTYKTAAHLRKIPTGTGYCSRSCRAKARAEHLLPYCANGKGKTRPGKGLAGERNPAWKGGVTYRRRRGNYVSVRYVRCPDEFLAMARKDGYVMEHRLVVARELGRPLLRSEAVHHVNHDPLDNRPENLMLFASNRDHKLYEAHGEPPPVWPT